MLDEEPVDLLDQKWQQAKGVQPHQVQIVGHHEAAQGISQAGRQGGGASKRVFGLPDFIAGQANGPDLYGDQDQDGQGQLLLRKEQEQQVEGAEQVIGIRPQH